ELVDPRTEKGLQPGDVCERSTVRELPRGIDRLGLSVAGRVIPVAPGADRIEILQRETGRVDLAMTLVASGDAAVLFELFADGRGAADIGIERLDVGRGRGRRRAED